MPSFGPITPVLRIFDEPKAKEFYVDFLGFTKVFEHRFGENFRCTWACRYRIAKDYKFSKPGEPNATPWQTLEATIADPFGNRVTFVQER